MNRRILSVMFLVALCVMTGIIIGQTFDISSELLTIILTLFGIGIALHFLRERDVV